MISRTSTMSLALAAGLALAGCETVGDAVGEGLQADMIGARLPAGEPRVKSDHRCPPGIRRAAAEGQTASVTARSRCTKPK